MSKTYTRTYSLKQKNEYYVIKNNICDKLQYLKFKMY